MVAMSLPNPPSLSSQIPNQPFQSPETQATFDRLSGVLTPNIQLDPNPTAPDPEPWQRPASWLALPPIKSTQEKFAGLLPIYNVDANFVAFTFEGDYIVDWGDGSTDYVASGDEAQHAYEWKRIPSTTLTSEGFKQVVVTVVPQSGSHLTTMNIAQVHDNVDLNGSNYGLTTAWLDIAVSMPNAGTGSSFTIGYTIRNSNLHKISIYNSGSCTDFSSLFEFCYNLREVIFENVSNVESMDSTFQMCHQLQVVNIRGLTSAFYLDYLFYYCYSLVSVNIEGLSSAESFNDIFRECHSLRDVRMTGLTSLGYSGSYDLMSSYVDTPAQSLTLEDLTSLGTLDAFGGWSSLQGSLKLTGLTSVTSLDSEFVDNYEMSSIHLSGLDNVTSATDAFDYCYSLQNVVLEGTQNIEEWDYCFTECRSLRNAPELDTSGATNMTDMFNYCYSLENVPTYDTRNVVNMMEMFYGCYSLQKVPQFSTPLNENLQDTFSYCYSLESIPFLDTSKVESFSCSFCDCFSLRSIPSLDVSSGTNFTSMFVNCKLLSKAKLNGTSEDISYNNCCLSRNAIVEIFNGLANASATIDISYNYGADDLTPADIAIAEDKGWTVLS